MKHSHHIGLMILFVLSSAFCLKQAVVELSYPSAWPEPHFDFQQTPLTSEKVALGRQLFYDPILSKDSTVSCASCHLSYSAFTHVDHALSHGVDDKIGTRNSPVLINLAWNKSFMWDGGVNHIEVQALAPITHAAEMGEDMVHVIKKLNRNTRYKKWFWEAFGDSVATGEFLLKALAQFQLTLVSANSKYDKVQRGEASFSAQELNGEKLFMQNCASCHQPPLFTTGGFANNGLEVDTLLHDIGRMAISLDADDSLKFKIPTLRNIEFSYPYMHDGRFTSLYEVLKHYDKGIVESKTLSKELRKGISLSDHEKTDIVSFLLTLSDKEFLFNPKFSFPRNKSGDIN